LALAPFRSLPSVTSNCAPFFRMPRFGAVSDRCRLSTFPFRDPGMGSALARPGFFAPLAHQAVSACVSRGSMPGPRPFKVWLPFEDLSTHVTAADALTTLSPFFRQLHLRGSGLQRFSPPRCRMYVAIQPYLLKVTWFSRYSPHQAVVPVASFSVRPRCFSHPRRLPPFESFGSLRGEAQFPSQPWALFKALSFRADPSTDSRVFHLHNRSDPLLPFCPPEAFSDAQPPGLSAFVPLWGFPAVKLPLARLLLRLPL
jgi:hypothetical protein